MFPRPLPSPTKHLLLPTPNATPFTIPRHLSPCAHPQPSTSDHKDSQGKQLRLLSIPALALFRSDPPASVFLSPLYTQLSSLPILFLSRQVDGGGYLFKLLIQPSSSYYKKAGLSIPQSVRAREVEGFLHPLSFVAVPTVYRSSPLSSSCLRRRVGSLLKLFLLPSYTS